MGKKSTKTNKTIFQTSREEAGLTRENASELLEFISSKIVGKFFELLALIIPSKKIKDKIKDFLKPKLKNQINKLIKIKQIKKHTLLHS